MSIWTQIGLSALGGAVSGGEKWADQKFAADQAREARKFSERMRNTQWQAAVADMEAAGLNPALAYSQGPNASPGGTAAAAPTGHGVVSSAMQAARMSEELKLLKQQARRATAEAGIAETSEGFARERAMLELASIAAETYRRRMSGEAQSGFAAVSRYASEKAPAVFELLEGLGGFLGENTARALNVRDRAFGAYKKPAEWAADLARVLYDGRRDLWSRVTAPLRGWRLRDLTRRER